MMIALAMLLGSAVAPTVMSADYCADQYVIGLADRKQIVAVSPDVGRDFSYLRDEAVGLRRARSDLETAIAIGPEVVLRSWGGDAARLERSGFRVVTLPYAADFADVETAIRLAADALGQSARGEDRIAAMRTRLSAHSAHDSRPVALYVTPGGVTAAGGTMIDAIFSAAGLANAASANGATGWPSLPVESLLQTPPALIVTGFFSAESERANAWSAVRHPALRRLFSQTPTLHLPADVLACPAWFAVDAVETIRASISSLADGS